MTHDSTPQPNVSAKEKRERLRRTLQSGRILVMPGVWDCVSARLVEDAGFESAFIAGQAVSASLLGMPDLGYLTLDEMVNCARRIARVVSIPLIADIDAGYGNALNLLRCVSELEQAGIAGIQLEDQLTPVNMTGRPVVPVDEMVRKINAVISCRSDPNFVVIGRTDAMVSYGIDEALRRVVAYEQAGADILAITRVSETTDLERITKAVRTPVMLHQIEGGSTPLLSIDQIRDMGFRVVTPALSLMFASIASITSILDEIKINGHRLKIRDRLDSVDYLNKLTRLGDHRELEKQYCPRIVD